MSGNAWTGKVTPADLRQAVENAITAGGDRQKLEAEYREQVKQAGSEEALAAAWTLENLLEDYRREMYKPMFEVPAAAQSETDIERLKQLVRQYPHLARDLVNGRRPPDKKSGSGTV